MAPRRTCTVCGRICEQGGTSRCNAHSTRWAQAGGTLSWNWTQIRNRKLQANPRCESCGRVAVTVDHILARAFGGTDDPSNLRSLCRACAKVKDIADQREGMRRARR